MSIRRPSLALAAVLAGALALGACATTPMGGAPTAGSSEFSADAFAWSTRAGQASIEGRVAYAQDGKTFRVGDHSGAVSFLQILAPELTDRLLAELDPLKPVFSVLPEQPGVSAPASAPARGGR